MTDTTVDDRLRKRLETERRILHVYEREWEDYMAAYQRSSGAVTVMEHMTRNLLGRIAVKQRIAILEWILTGEESEGDD
jgi:hypothetical protein